MEAIYLTIVIVCWIGLGLIPWFWVVLRYREITVEDLIALLFCVLFGPVALVIWVISSGVGKKVLFRW